MKRLRVGFDVHAGTNVYLQTTSDQYGGRLSSVILSCDLSRDDAAYRVKKLANYLGSRPRPKPVSWLDVMNRQDLFDDSYKDEQAGDLLRDGCKVVSSYDVKGGFLFGGPDMMKFTHEPSMSETKNDDARSKWNRGSVVLSCKHGDNHKCKVEVHKDSIEHLETIQKIIVKTFLREEIKKWNENASEKGKNILLKTESLLKSFAEHDSGDGDRH